MSGASHTPPEDGRSASGRAVAPSASSQQAVSPVPASIPSAGNGDFMIGGTVWPGLSKLIEECGEEVLQVGGKLMGSAGDTNHWSGDLRAMLIEELGDLAAAAVFFAEVNGLNRSAIADRQTTKLNRFRQWHRDTAQAIEARRAETAQTGSVGDESAVPQGGAQ